MIHTSLFDRKRTGRNQHSDQSDTEGLIGTYVRSYQEAHPKSIKQRIEANQTRPTRLERTQKPEDLPEKDVQTKTGVLVPLCMGVI